MYAIRSYYAWEKEYIDTIVSSPHGPALMANGNLVHVGKNRKVGGSDQMLDSDKKLLAAAKSIDDGKNWKISGYIPVPENVKPGASQFHEPHVVEASDGTLITRITSYNVCYTKLLRVVSLESDAKLTESTLRQG